MNSGVPTRLALRVAERKLVIFRHVWWALALGMLQPMLYLFGVGIGIGSLIDTIQFDGHDLDYLAYVAPGLMAGTAMNGALDDVISSLLFDLRETKVHDVTLATPVQPVDLAAGEVLSALIRGSLYSSVFLAVIAAFGAVPSLWGILTVPAAALIGLAFGCVGCAATTFMHSHADIGVAEFVMLPMFLFSATLFPPSVYPGPVRILAELSPLTRSADLMRCLTTGAFRWSIGVDVGYLLIAAAIGLAIASRRLELQLRH